MRFNGNGYWYDGNHSCDEASSPGYNALTLSSGSEIGLRMWRQVVGSTDALISSLQADIANPPDLPRTNTARNASTTSAVDSTNIFAFSTQPTASMHNSENDDLEPVWPYDLVSDADSNLFALAKRTYSARSYKDSNDWSNDAIAAARLGLGSEVAARISANISK